MKASNPSQIYLKKQMKKERIHELFEQFENACYDFKGIECWSARELQSVLGYSKWDNFLNVIDKTKKSCENAGGTIPDHFADIGKMIDLLKNRTCIRQSKN